MNKKIVEVIKKAIKKAELNYTMARDDGAKEEYKKDLQALQRCVKILMDGGSNEKIIGHK